MNLTSFSQIVANLDVKCIQLSVYCLDAFGITKSSISLSLNQNVEENCFLYVRWAFIMWMAVYSLDHLWSSY